MVQLRNKNGIFAVTHFVAGPEKELVFRMHRRAKINQRLLCGHRRPGLRQVKRNQAGDSVMIADDEGGPAFRREPVPLLSDFERGGAPSMDTMQRVELGGEGAMHHLRHQSGVVQQNDENQTKAHADGHGPPQSATTFGRPIVPVEQAEAKQRKNGWGDPIGQDTGAETEKKIAQKKWRTHAEQKERLGILSLCFTESKRSPNAADKKNRIEQDEFGGQKVLEESQRG